MASPIPENGPTILRALSAPLLPARPPQLNKAYALAVSTSLEKLSPAKSLSSSSPLKGRCDPVPEDFVLTEETRCSKPVSGEVIPPLNVRTTSSERRAFLSRRNSDSIREFSELFNSASKLRRVSGEHPLSPFSPRGSDPEEDIEGNANDVYMTNFPSSKEKDVVFKPGVAAALMSKICFGLTQLFTQLEKVIVPAKEGKATVISREDYGVTRIKAYNPEAKQIYLCTKDLMDNKVVLEKKKCIGEGIKGILRNQAVHLLPVDGHAGFYQINTLPVDSVSKSDEWDESSEDWDDDDTSIEIITNNNLLDDADEIERLTGLIMNNNTAIDDDIEGSGESIKECLIGRYVMHVATLPGKIDALVEDNALWEIVLKGDHSYLVPVEEIIQVLTDKEYEYLVIEGHSYSITMCGKNDFRLFPEEMCLSKPLVDNRELEKKYNLLLRRNQHVLVPKAVCVPYYKEEIVPYDGKNYEVSIAKGDFFTLQPAEITDEDAFLLVEDDWLEEDIIYTKFGKDYVRRNDQDYVVKEQNGQIQVIGENISGMVQLKVKNLFHTPAGASAALNLLEESAAREEFYDRIDMLSFIQAFIATILLRPQDGKVDDLSESNVLFQETVNEGVQDPLNVRGNLRLFIIDHDDMMPSANDFQSKGICTVRNGLMGFPQARLPLEGKDKLITLGLLTEIVEKKSEAIEFLKRFAGKGSDFNQTHIDAYCEVVDKLASFMELYVDKEWSLEQLFFFVFPEYEKQWTVLGELSTERKAQFIGKNPIGQSLKLSKRYIKG